MLTDRTLCKRVESVLRFIVIKKLKKGELILTIEEFNKALSAKADDGIKKFGYNGFIYFIPPTFIKSVKSDIIDLNVYKLFSGTNDTALLEFIIKRKKVGEIKVIYRTHIL